MSSLEYKMFKVELSQKIQNEGHSYSYARQILELYEDDVQNHFQQGTSVPKAAIDILKRAYGDAVS